MPDLIRHPVPYWIPAEVIRRRRAGNGIRVFCCRSNKSKTLRGVALILVVKPGRCGQGECPCVDLIIEG